MTYFNYCNRTDIKSIKKATRKALKEELEARVKLITDDKENIFIAKTINYEDKIISPDSKEFKSITNEANAQNKNSMLKSYDYLLSSKYKVVVNEKTLDRVKNYFK